jgi:spore coat-associated protein N
MADDKPTLTRRRVLGGMATIGAAGAVGASTWAEFSDTDSSTVSVTAGTFELNASRHSFSVQDVYPDESGSWDVTLTNTGSVAGKLTGDIKNVNNDGGVSADPESGNSGDLSGVLELAFSGAGGIQEPGSFDTVDWYEEYGDFLIDSHMTGGESHTLTIEWKVPDDAGNDIQGDKLTFDLEARLEQK